MEKINPLSPDTLNESFNLETLQQLSSSSSQQKNVTTIINSCLKFVKNSFSCVYKNLHSLKNLFDKLIYNLFYPNVKKNDLELDLFLKLEIPSMYVPMLVWLVTIIYLLFALFIIYKLIKHFNRKKSVIETKEENIIFKNYIIALMFIKSNFSPIVLFIMFNGDDYFTPIWENQPYNLYFISCINLIFFLFIFSFLFIYKEEKKSLFSLISEVLIALVSSFAIFSTVFYFFNSCDFAIFIHFINLILSTISVFAIGDFGYLERKKKKDIFDFSQIWDDSDE